MPTPVQQNQSLEQLYTAFIENMCKVSGKPEMAKPLIEGFGAYYNARMQSNPILESWLGDKAKKWIKIGIIPALLINGQVQKVLEKHRAEDDYNAIKAEVEDTLDSLTTIDVRVPYDLTGWNTNKGTPRYWHIEKRGLYNEPVEEYNPATCRHDNFITNYYGDGRLTIEDLLKDASSCITYCNDDELKKTASVAVELGKLLRWDIDKYLSEVNKSFNKDREEWDKEHPDSDYTITKMLTKAKTDLHKTSQNFAEAMQEYLDMRTKKYGDAEANRVEEYMHNDATRPEPNFKVTDSDKHCRVPLTAVRTNKYKDKDGKIHRWGYDGEGNASIEPDKDKFYKGRYPNVER